MVSVSQIYDTVLALIRKDKRGLSFSPDDYNSVLHQVNQRVWRINYHEFETSKLSMDELGSLKILDYAINLDANGTGILPTNYFHLVGDPWYTHTTAGRRRIDLVTTLEYGQRKMDYFTKPSALYPVCHMGYDTTADDMAIHVDPVTCTPIYLSYLRQTIDPFLDYYVNDTTLEITYMAEGATVSVPLGCTARDGTAGAASVVSQTRDFEWHPHDEPTVINEILKQVGISLPDELLVNFSNQQAPIIERE
jgi:hypothetical protein